jgi:hypothetical protein
MMSTVDVQAITSGRFALSAGIISRAKRIMTGQARHWFFAY